MMFLIPNVFSFLFSLILILNRDPQKVNMSSKWGKKPPFGFKFNDHQIL